MNKIELLINQEQLYLGSILLEPSFLDEARLRPKDFHHPTHKEIYQAMMDLKIEGKPVTFLTLAELGDSFIENIGGIDYLQQLAESVPSTASFKYYEQCIRDFKVVQYAANIANHFLEEIKEVHNIKYLQKFINSITSLEGTTVKPFMTFKEMVQIRMEHHFSSPEEGITGVNTGFKRLDKVTDGWQPTDLIVIGARPSMGKTAFILNGIARALRLKAEIEKKIRIIFFSIEMSEGQIIDRLIAIIAGLDLHHLKNPNKHFSEKDWENYRMAVRIVEDFDIQVHDERTVPEQRAILRQSVKAYPDHDHIIYIDFLTLMKTPENRASRNMEVEEIVIDLKQLARDFKIPVIVLAQLSRNLEQRNDKRPIPSDLRDSGAIEQAADVIGFLYRDEVYNKPKDKSKVGLTEVIIAKNRNGPLGTINYRFTNKTNTFTEIPA